MLSSYREPARKMQGMQPFLLCTKAGEPMQSSHLSSRVDYMWKQRLEPKLGFRAAGCNIARRCAVEAARRAHGKRRMTADEKEEERKHLGF